MAWSFRKRIKILPGVHINLSKSGLSTTIGVRGANVSIGKRGAYLNTGIPGTGLSNRQKISVFNNQRNSRSSTTSNEINYLDTESIQTSYENDSTDFDSSIQPLVKGGGFWIVMKGILFQIIPFGTLVILYKGLTYFNKRHTYVYDVLPNRISDRRFKIGYCIEGYSLVKTQQMRQLNKEEIALSIQRGKSYLWSIFWFFFFCLWVYLA